MTTLGVSSVHILHKDKVLVYLRGDGVLSPRRGVLKLYSMKERRERIDLVAACPTRACIATTRRGGGVMLVMLVNV